MSRGLTLVTRLVLVLAVLVAALAAAAAALRYTLLMVLVAAAIGWRRLGRWRGSTSHGSARVCSVREMEQAGMLGNDDGLILGRVGGPGSASILGATCALFSPAVRSENACGTFLAALYRSRWMSDRLVRVRDFVHLATFSRSGGGKGVSCLLPNLLSYRGSVVVIDPKCENFRHSSAIRRDRMGHHVVRLDPAGLGGAGGASFNPLDFIDANAPDFVDQCRDLANMLVVRQGTEHEPFWNDAAEMVLTAFIIFTCACSRTPGERNLETVRLIVSDRDKYDRAVDAMRRSANPVVQQQGGQLTWLVDKELGSVLTNVQRQTAWMASAAVAACLTTSSFDPRKLRSDGNVSVYLVIPAERMTTWAPLMRLWVGSFLRILMRDGADERRKVLFLLDEIAQLGRMQALEDAASVARGFGIRLWFIFQSMKQVEACYGEKAGVILDNIATMIFFALGNALETAEIIARRIGDETIRVYTPNSGSSHGTGTQTMHPGSSVNKSVNHGINVNQTARKLLFPDEILRLPEDLAIVFHKNMPVILSRLVRYYNAPEFRSGWLAKPRGLGPVAMVQAAFTLAASLMLAVMVAGPPMPGLETTRQAGPLTAPRQQGQSAQPLGQSGSPSFNPYSMPPGRSGRAVVPFELSPEERSLLWPERTRGRNRNLR